MFRLIEDAQNHKSDAAFRKLPAHITKGIRMGAYISGKQLVADLRKDMSKKKSGRRYRVYSGVGGALNRPRLHKASGENETPAVITGRFRKSIDFKVLGNKTLEFGSGANGLAKDYAKILEVGSSKMAARKPLGRTVKKLQNQVNTNIVKEINKQQKLLGFKVTKT
jgi:HK97 gp10 family phage protein